MISLLAAYLGCAVALLAGALVFSASVRWMYRRPASADRFVRWGWMALCLSLALPLVLFLGGVSPSRRPAVEIWSGPAGHTGPAPAEQVSLRLARAHRAEPAAPLSLSGQGLQLAAGLLLAGALLAGLRVHRAERRLRHMCQSLPVVKRVGRVVLAASDEGGDGASGSPFAAQVGDRCYVVVPASLFADPARLRLVLAHEAHHLRRGHVRGARWQAVLRALFFWNPAMALWQRASAELEDLACDRQVVARFPSLAREYARCLLWAASSGSPAPVAAQARSMAAGPAGALARRMRLLVSSEDGQRAEGPRPTAALLGGATTLVVLAAALSVHGCLGTPRTTAAEVESTGQAIQARSGFPIIADARIAETLNRRLNDPAWREGVKAGLARMPRYRARIEQQLREAGVPVELLAMVLSESRFDPLAHTSRPPERRAVGLWQLMPGTARRLGLAVSLAGAEAGAPATVEPGAQALVDDRLDPEKSTAAAARLLAELHKRFGDWPLAIAAYNGGAAAIEKEHGQSTIGEARDRLLTSQAEYGRYLVSVMISMLLIEDPSLLD